MGSPAGCKQRSPCSLGQAVESTHTEPGRPFLVIFFLLPEWHSCHLVGPPTQVFLAAFCARAGWHCPHEYSLVSEQSQIHE